MLARYPMILRRVRVRRPAVQASLIVALLGCQQALPPSAASGGPDPRLEGPWQPNPLVVEGAYVERWHTVCVEGFDEAMGSLGSLWAVDARGGNRVLLQYGGGVNPTVCELRDVVDGPRVHEFHALPLERPAADELIVHRDQSGVMLGAAGAAISQVSVQVPGLPDVTATIAQGRYMLWWPEERRRRGFGILRATGYDAAGRPLDSKIGNASF